MGPEIAMGLGSLLGSLIGGGKGSSPPGISPEEKAALQAEQERRKQLFQLGMPSLTNWMNRATGVPQEEIEREKGAVSGSMGETLRKVFGLIDENMAQRGMLGSGLQAAQKTYGAMESAKGLSSAIRDILSNAWNTKEAQETKKASMAQALTGVPPSALESGILSNISQRNLSSWEAEQQQGKMMGEGLAGVLSLLFPGQKEKTTTPYNTRLSQYISPTFGAIVS